MGSEVGSEYAFEQGLYYPIDGSYYGYYCSGFESPGEWDGQDPNFSGLQSENLPYVYYPPSYAYAESPYNPYNPYIPGAVLGVEGPYMGSQQFVASPSYQQNVTSPGYYPLIVQSELLPVGSPDPSNVKSTYAHVSSSSMNYVPSLVPPNPVPTSQGAASRSSLYEPARSCPSKGHDMGKRLGLLTSNKLSPSRGTPKSGVFAQDAQVKIYANSTLANQQLSNGKDSSLQQSLKITVPTTNELTSLGTNVHGWATVDKYRPRYFNGMMNNGSVEQNRGPRTNRSEGSAMIVRAYTTKAGSVNVEGNITIYLDQFNRDDFPIDYPDAKFFVIKSYSEDDVHKSIKYNVWSSTPNGNKRLDSAYEEAQRISDGKSRKCPVFLFFSVNASGQFCGVAEMVGRVDFLKDMDFWQQDKWTGSFPVKWHIVKDIPNASFRHIILENNENKPVTNSRDTQEITYLPGINMLSIFKSSPLRTSILDDFMFYEERQRTALEERFRLSGRKYSIASSSPILPIESSLHSGVYPSSNGDALKISIKQPVESERKQLKGPTTQIMKDDRKPLDAHGGQLKDEVDIPSKAEIVQISANTDKELPLKAQGEGETPKIEEQLVEHCKERPALNVAASAGFKQTNGPISQFLKGDLTQAKKDGSSIEQDNPKVSVGPVIQKAHASELPKTSNDPKNEHLGFPCSTSSLMKIGSLSIEPKIGETNQSAPDIADSSVDVVTVGSVHIKVKKPAERVALTVGSIPIDPKGLKLKMPDGEAA